MNEPQETQSKTERMTNDERIGKAAYETWCKALTTFVLTPWNETSERLQAAWIKAAEAAVEKHYKVEQEVKDEH